MRGLLPARKQAPYAVASLSTETARLAWIVSRRGWLAGDQVGGLLGDHDDRRVEIARNDRRHDRGVDHAQAQDAADPAFGIDHGVRVAAHAAAARRVVGAFGVGREIMVVNYGIGRAQRAECVKPVEWDEMNAIKLTSAVACAQRGGWCIR